MRAVVGRALSGAGALGPTRAVAFPPLADLAGRRRCLAVGSPEFVTASETRVPGSAWTTHVVSGRHSLTADLAPAAGGADEGPSPKEYLMASLASCSVMTVRTFYENATRPGSASRMFDGSTLDRVECRVDEFFEDGDRGKHLPLGLRVWVRLDGQLTPPQRERLVRAAERCPVKRMIAGDMKEGVVTREAPPL